MMEIMSGETMVKEYTEEETVAMDAIDRVRQALRIVSDEKYDLYHEKGISLSTTWSAHIKYMGEKLNVLTRVFNLSKERSNTNIPGSTILQSVNAVVIKYLMKEIVPVVEEQILSDRDTSPRYGTGDAHNEALEILESVKRNFHI